MIVEVEHKGLVTQLSGYEKKMSKDLTKLIKEEIDKGAKYLKHLLPYKTGKLNRSIKWDNNTIWTTSKVYKYLNDGVKPHKIKPKYGDVLKFQIGSQLIFTKYVDHPGIKARNYTNKTCDWMAVKTIKEVGNMIDKVIK